MRPFHDLSGKCVFITGAASGIGYEMALAFAREGADIIASDVQQPGLDALAERVTALGRRCRTATLDVTDEAAFDELFVALAADGELPDIVINNAGIGFMGGFLDTDASMWRRVLEVNVTGVANGCRAFLAARGERDSPAVLVNVASAASITPMPNMSAYAASKYAVEGLSEVLAMELAGSPVSVICVHPGVINTAIVSHPELSRVPAEQVQRLQAYYQAKGAPPTTVAEDLVAAVRAGDVSNLYTGEGVRLTSLLKRLLPRRRFRRLLLDKAREIGYL